MLDAKYGITQDTSPKRDAALLNHSASWFCEVQYRRFSPPPATAIPPVRGRTVDAEPAATGITAETLATPASAPCIVCLGTIVQIFPNRVVIGEVRDLRAEVDVSQPKGGNVTAFHELYPADNAFYP